MYGLILILDMFCVGCPGRVYCLAAYSLSCRGRFTDTGIIWNMLLIIYILLIMFRFVWKNHFVTYISLWHMLLYVGTYCDSGAWRAPMRGCCQPISSPQTGMYVGFIGINFCILFCSTMLVIISMILLFGIKLLKS